MILEQLEHGRVMVDFLFMGEHWRAVIWGREIAIAIMVATVLARIGNV